MEPLVTGNDRYDALQREILHLKQITNSLRTEKEILQKIFDNVPVMLSFFDSKCHLLLANPEWEKTIGWSAQEIQTQHIDIISECYPDPQDQQKAIEFIHKSNVEWAEFKTRVRDGRTIDTCWAIVHLSDGTHVAIGLDISELKGTQEKLEESQFQLSQAQQLTNIGNWTWELTSNQMIWSEELYRIFGLNSTEYKPKQTCFLKMMKPEEASSTQEILERARRTREPFDFSFHIKRPDGTERTLLSRGKVIVDQEGKVIRMFGTIQDVTNISRIEEMLRSSDEKLRALLARFESLQEQERIHISREIHDELSPKLTGLKMDLTWLERKLSALEDSLVRHKMQKRTTEAVQTVDAITYAMQEIATQLRPGALDNLGLVAALEYEARRFQERSGIACTISVSGIEPPLPTEISTALFRIFQEALSNVARHAQAKQVKVDLSVEDGWLSLEIKDNGRGITSQDIINTQSLGLIGIKERANNLGGKVTFEAAPDGGTIVTVCIPWHSKKTAEGHHAHTHR